MLFLNEKKKFRRPDVFEDEEFEDWEDETIEIEDWEVL
jgi:hypothetical protein